MTGDLLRLRVHDRPGVRPVNVGATNIANVGATNNSYTVPMRGPHVVTGRTPARLAARATWLVSRAHTRSSGLLNAAFEARGSGLRSHHYRLLAALEEWGPASQA